MNREIGIRDKTKSSKAVAFLHVAKIAELVFYLGLFCSCLGRFQCVLFLRV